MKTFFTLVLAILIFSLQANSQSGPELTFINPQLVSGTANQQGAVYRFSNVTTGVDAEIKLKKFSRNDIVMATVDNAVLGWPKAFQPEFGLPGLVAANQNWYIDFELTFYEAGKNKKETMDTVDLTALDVDGDGNSISEYVTYDKPNSITYSTVSFLTNSSNNLLGQLFECDVDGISSPLMTCYNCNGTGITNSGSGNNNECAVCEGSGLLYSACQHPYEGSVGNSVNGPISNFANIDTSATQVMAMYRFLNKSTIKFRYGAKSSILESNGSGIRLNSTWFRQFSLAPIPLSTLPVKLTSFIATLNNNKVDLEWITASETNASHFVIERSTDGRNYSEAGTVFAFGNTTSDAGYTFSDKLNSNQSGVLYYRLRTVDNDGKVEYSAVRIIRINKQAENTVSIITYPNPVSNEVRITIPASWQNKKVVYEIFNATGKTVSNTVTSNSGQTETINTSNLSRGFYIIRVSANGETAQQKIIKQ